MNRRSLQYEITSAQLQGALALICAGFIAHAVWLACVAEDAYITYRFARHIAEGHGIVWNVGMPPVEGYTNFLWLQLCVVALEAGLNVAFMTQVVGVLAGIGTLLVSWLFARRMLGLNHGAALFTVTAMAAAGPLAAWSSSGMETVFFTWCVIGAVYFATHAVSVPQSRMWPAAAMALLAATLTRPEGFGIAGVVFASGVWLSAAGRPRRRALLGAALYAATFAVYFIWRYQTFGYLLPNTFYAKTGGGAQQYWRGFIYVAYFGLHYLGPWFPWVVLGAWRATGPQHLGLFAKTAPDSRVAGLVFSGAVTAGYVGYVVLVGGDYMAMYRFMVPALPILFVLLGVCVDAATTDVPMTTARRAALGTMMLATIAGLLLQSTPYEQAVYAQTPRMHGTYRGIETERWHVNRFHVIADFFAANAPNPSASILSWDIGVLGYRTRFTIHDALGIVDPVIAHSTPDGTMGRGLAGHEKEDLRYSFSLQPTYVMYTVQLRPAPGDWPRYPPDLDARVRAEYDLKSAWLVDSANNEAGYFTYLQRKP